VSESLSDRELFVLGMVAGSPMHGHMINQLIQFSRAERWLHMAEKHVYYVLRKLEAAGYVTAESETPANAPARNVYSATDLGRDALSAELVRPERLDAWDGTGFTIVFSLLPAATWLSDDARTALMRRRRDALVRLQAAEYTDAMGEVVRTYFGESVTWIWERDRARLEAELAWLERFIERVEQGGWRFRPPAPQPR